MGDRRNASKIFIKSLLTFRNKTGLNRNKQYYIVFGSNVHKDEYFLQFYKDESEKTLVRTTTFKKQDFCGLEVGCVQTSKKRVLFWKNRFKTFLRLFFAETEMLEFCIEKDNSYPLQAFRTIESWRRKLSKELNYRCYWKVYMRESVQDWEEGYGNLHLTKENMAIVSTDKKPQTMGYWRLEDAIQCTCESRDRFRILFKGLSTPLIFETEDAEEIVKTLVMNMPDLESEPVYSACPLSMPNSRSRQRKSVKNTKIKPEYDSGSDSDEQRPKSPNICVPPSPEFCTKQQDFQEECLSPKRLIKLEKECACQVNGTHSNAETEDNNFSPYSTPARITDSDLPGITRIEESQDSSRSKGSYEDNPRVHRDLKLQIPRIQKPIVAPRTPLVDKPLGHLDLKNEIPRSPKPQVSPRTPLADRSPNPLSTFPMRAETELIPPEVHRDPFSNRHPQPPATPPPYMTLPPRLQHNGGGRRPVPVPRVHTGLSRMRSKSLESLLPQRENSIPWEINQHTASGGRILRSKKSRNTLRRKPSEKRPLSSLSDADVMNPTFLSDDHDLEYDLSNILTYLNCHRDDRQYRQSTVWYVNILSTIEKPPALPPRCDDSPPPLPARDKSPERRHQVLPTTTSEYWSAMTICQTLRNVLRRDPPLPDTLRLRTPIRTQVCMMLYIHNLGSKDWRDLADEIGLEYQAIELIEAFTAHHQQETAAEIVLRHWQFCYNRYGCNADKCKRKCDRKELINILNKMHRHDIINYIAGGEK